MRIWILTPAVLGLLFGMSQSARADIAPPLPPVKKEPTPFKIEVDVNAKGPKLVIPNGVFTPPRIRPRPPQPNAPATGEIKGELPVEDGDGVASDAPLQPRNHVIIAGLALTLSLAFGGVWLMRRKGVSSNRNLALLIAAGSSLAVGTLVWANAPPPIPVKKAPAPVLPVLLDTKVQIEFVYGTEPIRLIIDKETLEKLKKEPKEPKEAEKAPRPPIPG